MDGDVAPRHRSLPLPAEELLDEEKVAAQLGDVPCVRRGRVLLLRSAAALRAVGLASPVLRARDDCGLELVEPRDGVVQLGVRRVERGVHPLNTRLELRNGRLGVVRKG